ncbi:MAG: pilus assembly protein PilM [Planctomycetales bacterium]
MIVWKPTSRLPIGLFLEERSATLVQLAGRPGDYEIHALAQGELPHDETVPTEVQDEARAAALRKLIGDHHFKGREVVSCLGARELFVQNVRLPQLPPEEVRKVVHWEAEERLPYPAAEGEIRYLTAGEVRQDANVKQEVILLACHRGVVERHVRVLEGAGLAPVGIDVEPCAVLRCLRAVPRASGGGSRVAYLNLGERATTALFAEGDRVLFLKYVATGSAHMDQAVARHLDMNLAEAARMRGAVSAAAELDAEDDLHRSVIDAIRGPLESLASEVELCLRYYKITFRGKPLERIVCTGNDASPWLSEFLADRLSTPCGIGNPFEALRHWPPSAAALDRPWRWTTAMGLSMKRQPGA